MSDAPTAVVAPGHLEHDCLCWRCGYNLRMLSRSSVCPECGTPVESSIAHIHLLAGTKPGRIALGALLLAFVPIIDSFSTTWVFASVFFLGVQRLFWVFSACVIVEGFLIVCAVFLLAFSCESKSGSRRWAWLCCFIALLNLGARIATCTLILQSASFIVATGDPPEWIAMVSYIARTIHVASQLVLLVAANSLMNTFAHRADRPFLTMMTGWSLFPAIVYIGCRTIRSLLLTANFLGMNLLGTNSLNLMLAIVVPPYISAWIDLGLMVLLSAYWLLAAVVAWRVWRRFGAVIQSHSLPSPAPPA